MAQTSKKAQTAIDKKSNLVYNTGMKRSNILTKENKMNIDRFLIYITYSTECPTDIHPVRWAAMLTWATNRGWNIL